MLLSTSCLNCPGSVLPFEGSFMGLFSVGVVSDGGRPGGRARSVFDQGDMRCGVLQLIGGKRSHGYELIKAIEEKFGGAYSPSPGIIYPTLTLLEELGYARIAAETGGRKLYSITDERTAFLAANRPAVDTVMARIAAISPAYGGGPAPEIQRAMHNLDTAP